MALSSSIRQITKLAIMVLTPSILKNWQGSFVTEILGSPKFPNIRIPKNNHLNRS